MAEIKNVSEFLEWVDSNPRMKIIRLIMGEIKKMEEKTKKEFNPKLLLDNDNIKKEAFLKDTEYEKDCYSELHKRLQKLGNKGIRTPKTFKKQFMDIMNEIYKPFYYRGHADDSWPLIPSITRYFLKKEDEIIKKALLTLPQEFLQDHTLLEKLVRLQHFTFPTRLLDITSNPLVALYFACDTSGDLEKKDGKVISFFDKFQRHDEIEMRIFSCLALLPDKCSDPIKAIQDIYLAHHNHTMEGQRIFDTIKSREKYFFYQGPLNNPRIRIQQGAFLVFLDTKLYKAFEGVFKKTPYNDSKFLKFYKQPTSKEIQPLGSEYKTAIIKHIYKETILIELDQLGINHATLFPDLENYSKYIKSKYQ